MLDQNGTDVLEASPLPDRAELKMNLLILHLSIMSFLGEDLAIQSALEQFSAMTSEQLDFDVEYYSRHWIFDKLEHGGLEVALKTINVRHRLSLVDLARAMLRSRDEADRQHKQALVLSLNGRDDDARTAALSAVTALRVAGP